MAATYRIAVIGDWESVMGFRALGLDTYPVTSVDEAKEKVKELAKTDCAIIYLTEQLAKDMEDVLARDVDVQRVQRPELYQLRRELRISRGQAPGQIHRARRRGRGPVSH